MTPPQPTGLISRTRAELKRIFDISPSERVGLFWSFAYFFCVLAAYYIVRPVRDSFGAAAGDGVREWLFFYVFLVMLAAVPIFGKIVSSVPRRLVVPVIYGFFILNLMAFWVMLDGANGKIFGQVFYVWASVFNLFTISLVWITMSEMWSTDQAKRVYGFIAAGGSIGGIVGPLVAQGLVAYIGASNLLLVSAAFLFAAMLCALRVRAAFGDQAQGTTEQKREADIFAGASQVWKSPYLFQIALAIFMANIVSTFFYLEQLRIIGSALSDQTSRVQLLARMDLAVSVGTIVLQLLAASFVMNRLGVGIAAGILPAVCTLGFLALAIAPVLSVIVVIVVVERMVAFSIASPGMRVLYTLVEPEEKYRAQSFIDTAVYRGGDAVSGILFRAMTKGMGIGAVGLAIISIPLALIWLGLCLKLGNMHTERARPNGANQSHAS